MKTIVAIAIAILSGVATSAYATSTLSERAGKVDRIVQGHGQPGDTATSMSEPSVSFEVMSNGLVKRVDAKYGIITVIDPKTEARLAHGGR